MPHASPDAAVDGGTDAPVSPSPDAPPDAAPDAPPNTPTFDLTIAGSGAGEVAISQNNEVIAVCQASCSVPMSPGGVGLDVATPDDAGGIVSTGAASAVATFLKVPGERDLSVGTVYSVDFDRAGRLAVGTSGGVLVYDPGLTLAWHASPVGPARFAPSGDVYVVTASQIVKLDPGGTQQWSRPGGLPLPSLTDWNTGHQFATTPAGGLVINRNGSIDLWDAGGNLIARPLASQPSSFCVAAGPDGSIYLGVDDPDARGTKVQVETFSAQGVAVPGVFPARGLDDENMCGFATSSSQLITQDKGELGDWVEFARFGFDHTIQGGHLHDYTNVYDPPSHAVAVNAAGEVGFYYRPDGTTDINGMTVAKYSATDVLQYTIVRPAFTYADGSETGLMIYDIAVAPDGRVAVGGQYRGFQTGGGIVEVFP